MKCHPVEA